jgi:hypothetical protein
MALARCGGIAWWSRCGRRANRGGKFTGKAKAVRPRSAAQASAERALGHPERLGGVEIPRKPRQPDIAQGPIAKRRRILGPKGVTIASRSRNLRASPIILRMIISLSAAITIQLPLARNVIASTEARFLTVGRKKCYRAAPAQCLAGRRDRVRDYWSRKYCSSRWSRW